MTGVVGIGLIVYLLSAIDYGVCVKDIGNSVSHYKLTDTEKQEQNEEIKQKSPELLSLEQLLLLNMASKRFDSKSFFPSRGKKEDAGNPLKVRNGFDMMGFHGARGKRSLDSNELPYLLYYDNDYPLLRRLYPNAMQSFQPSYGESKRLDSVSFFGARGKRPNVPSKSDEAPSYSEFTGQQTNAYKSTDTTKPGYTSLAQVLKRQPPPGFYALRG